MSSSPRTTTPFEDAMAAYEAAVERAEILRKEWDDLGRPVMAQGGATGRAPVPHPLIRAIQEAEVIAHKLREPLLKKHAGPEPSAVVQPLRTKRITRKAG